MSVSRLLFFCSIGLATAHIPVQRTIAARDSAKVMKLEIIAGRILISAKCRTKGCAAKYSEPTTQSKTPPAHDRFCCDHLMDPLRRAKNVGFTISLDIKSFFGTSIRTIGSDPGRP